MRIVSESACFFDLEFVGGDGLDMIPPPHLIFEDFVGVVNVEVEVEVTPDLADGVGGGARRVVTVIGRLGEALG